MIGQEEIDMVLGLTSFMSEHPVIIDGGANKGDWSDIILKEYGDNCTIHAFEPSHKLIDFLEIKYEYRKNIIFNEVALSYYKGRGEFYYFENFNNELSSLYEQDWWKSELPMKQAIVEINMLDVYCKEKEINYIDYLKIDVEGSEFDILVGAANMIKEGKIKIIQIEYGGHYQVSESKFADVIKMVNEYGYKVYSYDAKTKNYNEVRLESFIEDYHYENYIITKCLIPNQNPNWNKMFIENTKDLGKFELAIEVGCNEGGTSRYICENLLEEKGHLICIDPLEDYYKVPNDVEYFKDQYKRFIRNTKGLPIDLMRDKSRVILPRLHALRAGFIYIDGDHAEEEVYWDAVNSFKITKIGGFLLFDDWHISYDYGRTHSGIERFLKEYENRFEIVKENYQLLIRKISD